MVGTEIVGLCRPTEWYLATRERFKFLSEDVPLRIGFEWIEAKDVWDKYVGKRAVPRKRGALAPFIYLKPH